MSYTPIVNTPRLININNLNSTHDKYNLDESRYKIKLHPHQLTLLQACINFENEKIYLKNRQHIVDNYNVGDNDYIRTNMGVIGDKLLQFGSNENREKSIPTP